VISRARISNRNFGECHRYSVAPSDGNDFVFSAPTQVHQIIADRKLLRGSQFILRKATGKLELALTGTGQEHKAEESGDGYRVLMELSRRDAIEAMKAVITVQWDAESIRGIRLTLFIQWVKMA